MQDFDKLSDLIEQVCSEEGVELEEIFDMPQSDNTNFILHFEEKFSVKLPDDYKSFLLKYGSGGMNDGNNQIVTWSWLDDGETLKKANNFEEYFIEKLEDYL